MRFDPCMYDYQISPRVEIFDTVKQAFTIVSIKEIVFKNVILAEMYNRYPLFLERNIMYMLVSLTKCTYNKCEYY